MGTTTANTTAAASGQFYTANGEIVAPNGSIYTAKGINLYDAQMPNAAQVLADFPGINFIRLNCYNYQSPSAYASFIQKMSAAGVVVELEDHTNSTGSNAGGGSGSAFTGQQLTNEMNWYSALASAYANNPYVWFGTNNEPPGGGLSTWEQQTYNAIRGTGNNNPIMMELPGGGEPGFDISGYGMDPSVYTSMTNIIADAHFYGWSSNYSTNQSTVNSALASLVSGAQAMVSASGAVPVIIGEYGPSTTGVSNDANASQVETAVQTATEISGSVAWGWDTGEADNLTDGSGNLTSYGQEVANFFASTPNTGTKPTTQASANDTVVMAGSSNAIVDANGNAWTITGGAQVAANGVTDTSTSGVIELAYVNGTIWQENNQDLWWYTAAPNAGWSGTPGIATSPLPQPVKPSANDTVVTLGSTAAITDANGNAWTITSGGQVAANGVTDTSTSGAIELAYVNGTIWQENNQDLWWYTTAPNAGWSGTPGIATSPLPVTPSANDTTVTLGSTAAIVDPNGNAWTLTSGGQVAANGVTDTSTYSVIELAYVNGAIWEENNQDLWWYTTAPDAGWAGGSGTSPLPVSASANDSTVTAGSTAAIIDGSGNKWTINSNYLVAVNGAADTTTANVIELAYVNGTIWQENASDLWWSETTPTAGWSGGMGIATSPLPAAASASDTMVLAGSTAAIIDASNNAWTITSGGLVAVNGTADPTTANVIELAYVNGTIWQENASDLWWDETTPTAGWSGGMGIAASPLPATIGIAANTASATVTQSEVSVAATSGTNMLFISGSNDIIDLSGGTNTVTETGTGNTFILPAAGAGTVTFASDILSTGDTLDLKTALAATNWNNTASTLSEYVTVADTSTGAVVSVSATSGGSAAAIATINGATMLTESFLLTRSIT